MLLVGAVAGALAATGTFEKLLGLAIAEVLVIDGLTVAALFPLRAREPRAPFSVPGYPAVPILFIGVYLVLFIWTALGQSQSVDRKSTRLNSSHLVISYAVFCLKKKKKNVL